MKSGRQAFTLCNLAATEIYIFWISLNFYDVKCTWPFHKQLLNEVFVIIQNNRCRGRGYQPKPKACELDMITRDLKYPWHNYCIISRDDITGVDLENSLYVFRQSEKR